jgi:hypothetical protein
MFGFFSEIFGGLYFGGGHRNRQSKFPANQSRLYGNVPVGVEGLHIVNSTQTLMKEHV